MGALTVVNVTVTVKVSLHIQACGKGSWAVRGFPSCGCIRQQCGQTVHSVLFFQMCSVLNSTSHNMECSDGLTVNGLHVITPPHNMYCTGTQESGTSATQPNDDNQHTHTHAHVGHVRVVLVWLPRRPNFHLYIFYFFLYRLSQGTVKAA